MVLIRLCSEPAANLALERATKKNPQSKHAHAHKIQDPPQ